MLLIILPVRNESKTINGTAIMIKEYLGKDSEALFIDDHSTDDTFEKLKQINHPRIKAIKNRFDGGKGSALKAGYIMSDLMYKLKDSDLICFLDGDGQIEPREIDTLKNIMAFYNADCVIGNKRHLYSSSRYSVTRRIISETYNLLTNILFDIKLKDTQCGIKLFKKDTIEQVVNKINLKRYAFDLELIVAMKENHFRIADAPVRVNRQLNRGSIGVYAILSTFLDTIKIFINKTTGRYVCQK